MSARPVGRLGPGAQVQQLHLVGVTTDHDSLIFSVRKGAKSGSYVLPLDDALLQALADAVRRRSAESGDLELPVELDTPAPSPRRQSQLSPREIQDRLRAGRSLEEIAAVAGVGEEWVARFAAPVEAERSQIVHRARQLIYPKPRRGDSAEPLGLSVRWNLAERGLRLTNDEFDAAWSGYQVTDETWMVTFAFVSRKRAQEAEWEVDLRTNELVGRNRLASDLGYVEAGRRRRSMASLQPATPALGTRRIERPVPAVEAADPTPTVRAKPKPKPKAKAAARPKPKPTARDKAKPAAKSRPKAATAPVRKAAARRPGVRATAVRKAASPRTTTRSVAKKSSAKRAAPSAKKALPTKRGRAAASPKKKVPPAPPAAVEKVLPNELGLRRLQLVSGAPRSSPSPRGRPAAPVARPRPSSPPAVRIAAVRSADAVAAAPTVGRTEPAAPVASPPASALDVVPEIRPAPADAAANRAAEAVAAAEARRSERRRARAAARTGYDTDTDTDTDTYDGRVVTIRANRATPPTADSTGDVVVPGDRPPLRAAQPAAQPNRRRYSRSRSK